MLRHKRAPAVPEHDLSPSQDSSSCSDWALYAPLEPSQGVRLFHLAPAEEVQNPLLGRLEVTSLSLEPTYEALSYTWDPPFKGQVIPDDSVEVGGHSIRITGNLGQALRRLRHTRESRPVWVDAVCIDQSNRMERGEQVANMASIYGSAQRVVLWLGEDSQMKDCHFVYNMATGLTPSIKSRHERDSPLTDITPEFDEEDADLEGLSEIFLSRRTFQRRWIIGELCHATTIDVVCGSLTFPWLVFFRALQVMLRHRRLRASQNWQFGQRLRMLEHLRQTRRAVRRRRFTAMEILCSFGNLGCQDPIDRVYALTSLWDMGFINVNYKLSPEQVYYNLAKAVVVEALDTHQFQAQSITHLNHLLFIAAFQAGERGRLGARREPSWVPDWRFPAPEQAGELNLSDAVEAIEINGDRSLKAYVPYYGTIDSLIDGDSLRLLMPKGIRYADLKNVTGLQHAFERFAQNLRSGDFLCAPVFRLPTSKCRMGVILRGAMQKQAMKVRIIGLFPIDLFGTSFPEPLPMQVQIL